MENKTISVLEYIWIGGKNEIRSKTRVIYSFVCDISNIPEWNYDGSSTWQADSNSNTEIILKPCALYKDPIRNLYNIDCYLVLCDTYDINGNPTNTNHRFKAQKLFERGKELIPWFGLEQEYFLVFVDENKYKNYDANGYHYCGTAYYDIERKIVQHHLSYCIEAGVNISGLNAEVSANQWEFQIGPNIGISAGDDLIIARYLLQHIAESYNVGIYYNPKPYKNINGSGCHINFSTCATRNASGIVDIYKYIERLNDCHDKLINNYGEGNRERLTGIHETSSYDTFSWGIGTRNTSVRIPNHVIKDGCGYFEDRRPAANIDPYLATSSLFEACCLD